MIIPIQDKECWVCGLTKKKLTTHHTIPKHLNPKKNILVPVCEECHDKINSNDITGMYSYVNKLICLSKQINSGVGNLDKTLNNFNNIKITNKIKKLEVKK